MEVSREELVEIIRTVVREELREHDHSCRFDLEDDQVKDVEHCVRMISSVGGGDLTEGIDTIKRNHEWLSLQRERADKASNAIMFLVASAIIGGLLSALWLGLKTMIITKQ